MFFVVFICHEWAHSIAKFDLSKGSCSLLFLELLFEHAQTQFTCIYVTRKQIQLHNFLGQTKGTTRYLIGC